MEGVLCCSTRCGPSPCKQGWLLREMLRIWGAKDLGGFRCKKLQTVWKRNAAAYLIKNCCCARKLLALAAAQWSPGMDPSDDGGEISCPKKATNRPEAEHERVERTVAAPSQPAAVPRDQCDPRGPGSPHSSLHGACAIMPFALPVCCMLLFV
jgi:hypothetical protein